ncbi:diptericin-D-like [Episyrphus balteatus]|uniref:diptericin-D-like n=1 Tax=Episyrphus balteatus TaxID=286459 RepID=UPI00248679D0|nr:diptericin-D-like [Episyrphus balteatus]
MNNQLIISFFFCLCMAAVLGQSNPTFNFNPPPNNEPSRFNLDGTSVGGSRGQGYDVNVNSKFPLWTSQSGRNTLDGTAQFQQHMGGPWGNSRPNYGGGLIFTHRF